MVWSTTNSLFFAKTKRSLSKVKFTLIENSNLDAKTCCHLPIFHASYVSKTDVSNETTSSCGCCRTTAQVISLNELPSTGLSSRLCQEELVVVVGLSSPCSKQPQIIRCGRLIFRVRSIDHHCDVEIVMCRCVECENVKFDCEHASMKINDVWRL